MIPDKEELAKQIDIAPWDLIRAHLERSGIIIVSVQLSLVDVAYAVAADQKATVERWLVNSLLAKPTTDQIHEWDEKRSKIFSMIVISPFVLIQEVSTTE